MVRTRLGAGLFLRRGEVAQPPVFCYNTNIQKEKEAA